MSFGIHKPEQGYWVRVLSAVFFGVLVLAGAAWAWSQAEAVELPARGWVLELGSVNGEFPEGSTIDLVRAGDDAAASDVTIAQAGVLRFVQSGTTTARVEIADPEITGDLLVEDTERIRAAGASARVTAKTRIPIFPLIYLQAGVTATIMLIGAVAVYFFIATNRRSVDFLINTDGEMRKVNWSTKKEIIGSTQVVIVAAFLIAAILFGIDLGFQAFFKFIGVLQT
jgi:preprotein translocase SecE subunit